MPRTGLVVVARAVDSRDLSRLAEGEDWRFAARERGFTSCC